MSSSSRSGPRGGGSNDEADWRSNRCFLPPWHEHPKCKCGCPCIIDVWEFDAPTGTRGITSSVPILIQILWYGILFCFEFFYLYLFAGLLCTYVFQSCKFCEWIDMSKPSVSHMSINRTESKRLYLEQMEEMREIQARQLQGKELDIRIKKMHYHMRGTELEQEELREREEALKKREQELLVCERELEERMKFRNEY
jgi:hypothetical protein